MKIVNVVASGDLNIELDLKQIATDTGPQTAQYNPSKYPGMYLRIRENDPLITLYRTGKYITTGADSVDETYATRDRFLNFLSDMSIIETPDDEWFRIQNLVCTGEFDQTLNLNALAIGFGLEQTEYEPEQFPGLIYRPPDAPCVALLFATGRVVITGSPNIEEAETVFKDLRRKIQQLLAVD